MSLYLYKYIDRVATSVGSLDLDPEKNIENGDKWGEWGDWGDWGDFRECKLRF